MREKQLYWVLSFGTTQQALAWEKQCAAKGVPGRLIPLPREISAGCGLAWRMLPQDWSAWQAQLRQMPYEQAIEIEL